MSNKEREVSRPRNASRRSFLGKLGNLGVAAVELGVGLTANNDTAKASCIAAGATTVIAEVSGRVKHPIAPGITVGFVVGAGMDGYRSLKQKP